MRIRKRWSIAAVCAMLLLGGCTSGPPPGAEDAPLIVAAAYVDGFADNYGDYLAAAYPDMTYKIIEMKLDFGKGNLEEQVKTFVEREKPDLILPSSYGNYLMLADNGLLENLSSRMLDSGMKEDDFQPGVMERLKQNNGGQIYGLAPFFDISVLAYNEDLFKQYSIPLPHSGMTMPEIYTLAGQFAKAGAVKEGIVGFHQARSSLPSDQLLYLANGEGLQAYNYNTGKVTVDTPVWKSMFQTVVELYKSGTLMLQDVKPKIIDGMKLYDREATMESDLFGKGKAAMTIADYNQYADSSFNSGQVTPPVTIADAVRTNYMQVSSTMSIRAGSPNADKAWKAIQFLNGDYVAKVKSKLQENGFPSLKSYRQYNTDPLVGDLFELHAVPQPVMSHLPPVQMEAAMGFDNKLAQMENEGIIAVINGEKSLDEVIADIQKQGQDLFGVMLAAGAEAAK